MSTKEGAACPQPAKHPQNITTVSTSMNIERAGAEGELEWVLRNHSLI